MKENKFEELMFLSAIGEICDIPDGANSKDIMCFKPHKNLSNSKALCLTNIKDERDCVIQTRLNSFQKKMGLNEVVTEGCGLTRLKSMIITYMLTNNQTTEDIKNNCAKNLQVMASRNFITDEQANLMNDKFVDLVDNFQKSYDEQSSLIF